MIRAIFADRKTMLGAGFLALACGAYALGAWDANKAAEAAALEARINHIEQREDLEHEIESIPDAGLRDELMRRLRQSD